MDPSCNPARGTAPKSMDSLMRMYLASALAISVATVQPARAQGSWTGPNMGMASSFASGLSLDAVGRGDSESTRVKSPGMQTTAPPAWSSASFPNDPNYSLSAVFGALDALVEVTGHSTGNDLIAGVSSTGVPVLNFSWLSINVSVSNSAIGLPGSLVRARRTSSDPRQTPGSDILSYYVQSSQGIAGTLAGSTLMEQPAEAISYAGNEDVDALDFAMGVLAHSQPSGGAPLFPYVGSFYFSLAPSCVAAVNTACGGNFALDGLVHVPADAATIYRSEWDPGLLAWHSPAVYRSAAELGLVVGIDEVDAVAVNEGTGLVVFSTQLVRGRSQLLAKAVGQGVVALTEQDGTRVTTKIGIIDDRDDIDAVCIIDPEIGLLTTHAANPIADGVANKQIGVGLSVTRAGKLDRWTAQVTGWGEATPQACIVSLLVSDNYVVGQGPWSATWSPVATEDRQAWDDVTEFELVRPNGYAGQPYALMAVLQTPEGYVLTGSWIGQIALD